MDLNRIATFVEVVEAGNFTAGAQALGLPVSSVSRSVAHLEAELGVQLLQRTTRKVLPTEAGRLFFARVRSAVETLDQAASAAAEMGETPRGTVRVTTVPHTGAPILPEAIVEFTRKYPEIRVELEMTSRVVDLVGEGFDLAVRAGRLVDSSLIARKIRSVEAWLVASPQYLAEREEPLQLTDLTKHQCVLHRGRDGHTTWRLTGPHGEADVDVHGAINADDLAFLHETVLAGAGIGLMPSPMCQEGLKRGTLQRILPEYAAIGAAVFLVWPASLHVPTRVVLLREFLGERLQNVCNSLH